MIRETIVTTCAVDGTVHIAPMGVHVHDEDYLILPFRPSKTLENIQATGTAILNHTDDVRVFAGCLTGRRDWPLLAADRVSGSRLADCLAHQELALYRTEDDSFRPKLFCREVHSAVHAPFAGFNRAQFAVLEAAILVSRLDRLTWEKIAAEIAYLEIGLRKCAGARELEAWDWLMQKIDAFRQERSRQEQHA